MSTGRIEEHTAEVAGRPVFWRTAEGSGSTPILYLHGVPSSSTDWLPFLERTGGIAPDLPGYGRSGKAADGPYSIDGYADWIEAFLDHLEIERVRLVVHDWGVVGLAWAQRSPDRVERLVVIDAVPLLPGYRWHRLARLWRRRFLGELAMGFTLKPVFKLVTREANHTPGPLPADFIDEAWSHFDQGTQRAILKLYRSAPAPVLEAAGRDLGRLTAPALVLWGVADPYIPVAFADAYGAALPNAKVERVQGAGHWPWLDRPDVIDDVVAFLAATG